MKIINVCCLLALIFVPQAHADDDPDARIPPYVQTMVSELELSSHLEDRWAAALLSEYWDDSDASEFYVELLEENPGDAYVLHRAITYCISKPESQICSDYPLTEMYLTADPGNALPHLLDAVARGSKDNEKVLWKFLELAAGSSHIRGFSRHNFLLFLNMLERHPKYVAQMCEANPRDACGASAKVIYALGMVMALVDHSWADVGICAREALNLSNYQLDICRNLVTLMQNSEDSFAQRIGASIELRMLEQMNDDPDRVDALHAQQQHYNNIMIAADHAIRISGFHDNADLTNTFVNLLLEKGELAALEELARIAGISTTNPPPACLEPEVRQEFLEELLENQPNYDANNFLPVCPDHLMP